MVIGLFKINLDDHVSCHPFLPFHRIEKLLCHNNIICSSASSYKGNLGGGDKVRKKVLHLKDKDFLHDFVYGVVETNKPKLAD